MRVFFRELESQHLLRVHQILFHDRIRKRNLCKLLVVRFLNTGLYHAQFKTMLRQCCVGGFLSLAIISAISKDVSTSADDDMAKALLLAIIIIL